MKFTIAVLDKAPAMTHTRYDIEAADYPAAVAELHEVFKRKRRTCYLYSLGSCQTPWHTVRVELDGTRLTGGGLFSDRNTNGGVVSSGYIAPEQPASVVSVRFWDVEHVCLFCSAKRWTTKRAADPMKCYACGQSGGSFASRHNLAKP